MRHPYPYEEQLLDAINFEDFEWAKSLLRAGAATEARDERFRTPLHLAVLANDPDLVQALLDAGANVNARDDDGCTPLHLAAGRRLLDVAYLLILAGADVNARDDRGSSVLWRAMMPAFWGDELVRLLRRFGARGSSRNRDGFSPRDVARRLGIELPATEPAPGN